MNEAWNLGDGLVNVCDSVMRKLQYASNQLEERNKTIINVDSYEVSALIRALYEYMIRSSRGGEGMNEGRKPVHEYVDDFMNCKKKEDCRDCTCQNSGDFYICVLLQHYKDKVIEKLTELI